MLAGPDKDIEVGNSGGSSSRRIRTCCANNSLVMHMKTIHARSLITIL